MDLSSSQTFADNVQEQFENRLEPMRGPRLKIRNWESSQYNKGADFLPAGEIVKLGEMEVDVRMEGKDIWEREVEWRADGRRAVLEGCHCG